MDELLGKLDEINGFLRARWSELNAAAVGRDELTLRWGLLFDKCRRVDASPFRADPGWLELRKAAAKVLRENLPVVGQFPRETEEFEAWAPRD
jgi:hypothetical protein